MLGERETIRLLWCVVGVILLAIVLVLCCVRKPETQSDTMTEQEFVIRCREKFERLADAKAIVCINERYRVRLER